MSGFAIQSDSHWNRPGNGNFELVRAKSLSGIEHMFRGPSPSGLRWTSNGNALPIYGGQPRGGWIFDEVSLIQSTFVGPDGNHNLELVAVVGDSTTHASDSPDFRNLAHVYRESGTWKLGLGEFIPGSRGVRGNPAFVQGRAGGSASDFQVIVPDDHSGFRHFHRENAATPRAWVSNGTFLTELGRIDGLSMISSSYGHLEGVAVAGGKLIHFFRTDDGRWMQSSNGVIASDVTGIPSMIENRFVPPGGQHGDFEVVVPLKRGGVQHFLRQNTDLITHNPMNWRVGKVFGAGLFPQRVALFQSDFITTGDPDRVGHLEVIVDDGRLLHFWRDTLPIVNWHGPSGAIPPG
ncbi:MAG: hypothetical protein K8W52_35330 [Deltaproteobacteria bacterium]|nr:hypothetical protein [Deltaproteobacteria bacterium]